MKNIRGILFVMMALVMLSLTSCVDDNHDLGKLLTKSEIKYSVTQDLAKDPGGNTIAMVNNTPGTVSMWDFGTGRSNKAIDSVHFAFKGTYVIKFSVATAGGIVECDPVTVVVTDDNLKYVNDPLWTLLTNGVGNEKTWIIDNGKYGLATGPMGYADPSRNQVWGDFQTNWDPSDVGQTADDMAATMTFKLKGGPFLTTVKPNEGSGGESGTFYFDAKEHTLSTTDATIIRLAGFIGNASNWTTKLNVLVLTENQLRISIYRTNSEGAWWYIFNYVSKDYADNYVPQFVPDPNFSFGDQMAFLAGNSATTWKFATDNPFNWTDLNGGWLNTWNTISDYPDWTGYNASAVPNIDNVRLTFTKTGDVSLMQDNGDVQNGIFTINEATNMISFDVIKPSIYISGGWVSANTSSLVKDDAGNVISGDNQWKIVKVKTIAGVTTEVWFGQRDGGSKQYMVFHFILASGIPNVEEEMIKGLCGKATGTSSRTFKIDLNHPVDWTDIYGENGWTVAGVQDGWYWSSDIAASVKSQTLTFSQTNGVVSVSKKDEDGNITTSDVDIDPATRNITIADIDIIKFGAGSWLPTSGPTFHWVKGEYNEVATDGLWIGVQSNTNEYTAYHYILK